MVGSLKLGIRQLVLSTSSPHGFLEHLSPWGLSAAHQTKATKQVLMIAVLKEYDIKQLS